METAEQSHNRTEHLKPWQFKKGQSGNPSGRPKGSVSLKEWAKNYIQTLPDEEKLEFLEGMNKKDVWEMAEGKPQTHIDHTTKGEAINVDDDTIDRLIEARKERTKSNDSAKVSE